jgi:PAS domain S-box-containing protein
MEFEQRATARSPALLTAAAPFPSTEWRIVDELVVDARGVDARPADIGHGVWMLLETRYPGNPALLEDFRARLTRSEPFGPALLESSRGGIDVVWIVEGESEAVADGAWQLLAHHVTIDRQQQLLSSATHWIDRHFAARAPVQFFELSDDLRLENLTPAREDHGTALPADALGRRIEEFATPDGPGDVRDWAPIRDRLRRGEALPHIDLRSGDRHWRISIEPIPSDGRGVQGARHRGVLIDGTEVRRAQERASTSERTLRRLIDRIPIPMVVWNEHNRVATLNPAAAELAGVSADAAKGASILDVARIGDVGDDQRRILDHPTSASRGLSTPFAFRCGDGRRRWFRASAMPIDQGGRTLRATLYVDVTESLERTQVLEQVSRLESLERFASTMAHDLANVVTVVSCSVNVLEHGERDDVQEAAEDVRQALRTADGMLQRLRQVASTRNADCRAEPVVVAEVAERAARLMRSGGDDAPPSLKVIVSRDAAHRAVQVDPLDLERATLNLLTNATDAAGPQGAVRVDVSTTDSAVKMTVEDDGPGIPLALRERVFDPLFTTKGERGTGLGLAQVAAFVEQSGGRLRIGDGALGGARLELELPVEPGATAPETTGVAGSDEPTVETPHARRVLLVDDHHAVRRGIARMFRRADWTVDECEDAESAMRELMHEPLPDLLVSDIVMPGGMDGLDLAQWCHDTHPDLPLILLSGHAPRVTDLEVVHFLEKPIAESELMRLADGLVESGR